MHPISIAVECHLDISRLLRILISMTRGSQRTALTSSMAVECHVDISRLPRIRIRSSFPWHVAIIAQRQ